MRYQKKLISPKQFYINYNNKLSNILKIEHFEKLQNITKDLEKKIKTKKKFLFVGMVDQHLSLIIFCVILIRE